MPINYPALKAEIQNDPLTYGYAAFIAASEPEKVAAALNKARDGTDGELLITVRRADISPQEVLEAIDNRDFIATPGTAFVAWFESITQLLSVRLSNDDGTDTKVLDNLKRLVTNAQGTQTRINNIARRNGSRAEQLFGTGTVISTADVGLALRS